MYVMDSFLFKFMRGQKVITTSPGPPGSRGRAKLCSAVPKKGDTGMRRGAGWEGELPLKGSSSPSAGSQAAPVHLLLSQALAAPGRDGAAAELLPGTMPGPDVQLIVEGVQAGVEKAGKVKWGCLGAGKEKGV